MEGASQRIGRLLIDIASHKEMNTSAASEFLNLCQCFVPRRVIPGVRRTHTEVETKVASDEIEGSEALR